MAGERHGNCSWPGVVAPIACTITLSQGIRPAVARLEVHPGATPAVSGTLTLFDGVTTINLPNCKLDRVDSALDGTGQRVTLSILDRRWRWQDLGRVSGEYNLRDPHNYILPWTAKTPTQLAVLCLEAMGEVGYVVSLPDDYFPEVHWDHVPPAHALQQLCEERGYAVCYRADTDTVLVAQRGVGDPLPAGSVARASPTLDSKERPDSIVLVGAPVRHQTRMWLEAVGEEWDGSYVPINFLSYVPTGPGVDPDNPWSGGWHRATPTDRLSLFQALDLADRSVYRCYRVLDFYSDGSPLVVPGYGPVSSIYQLLLEDTAVEQVPPPVPRDIVDPAEQLRLENLHYNGWSRDQPAVCYGIHTRFLKHSGYGAAGEGNTPAHGVNAPRGEQVLVPFDIDPKYYVITFAQPVYRYTPRTSGSGSGSGGAGAVDYAPALLWLDTAVQVRDPVTNAVRKYEAFYAFPPPVYGTGPKVIRRPDVWQNVIGAYDPDTHAFLGASLDIPDADVRAAYYLLGEAAQWADTVAQDVEYNGLMPVYLDGAIQQVTWSVGPGGAKTGAGRGTDYNLFVPTLPERRRLDHLAPALVEARERVGAPARDLYRAYYEAQAR
jgi:hypothetical protein